MHDTESAIYKTLAYQSIFNSLPTLNNLQYFLISDFHIGTKDVVSTINFSKNIQIIDNFVCFRKDSKKVETAKARYKNSKIKIEKAKKISQILKLIPWFKMIGISGAVASYNAVSDDDIDLFVIVSKNRIWLARFCDYLVLNILRVRRNAKSRNLNNKICINFYLTDDNLELKNKDIYSANEIARLIPLHGDSVYNDFINANKWISKYLANFWDNFINRNNFKTAERKVPNFFLFDLLNSFLGKLQRKYMMPKMSREEVSEKEIRFHPMDLREKVIKEYEMRVRECLSCRQS